MTVSVHTVMHVSHDKETEYVIYVKRNHTGPITQGDTVLRATCTYLLNTGTVLRLVYTAFIVPFLCRHLYIYIYTIH